MSVVLAFELFQNAVLYCHSFFISFWFCCMFACKKKKKTHLKKRKCVFGISFVSKKIDDCLCVWSCKQATPSFVSPTRAHTVLSSFVRLLTIRYWENSGANGTFLRVKFHRKERENKSFINTGPLGQIGGMGKGRRPERYRYSILTLSMVVFCFPSVSHSENAIYSKENKFNGI